MKRSRQRRFAQQFGGAANMIAVRVGVNNQREVSEAYSFVCKRGNNPFAVAGCARIDEDRALTLN